MAKGLNIGGILNSKSLEQAAGNLSGLRVQLIDIDQIDEHQKNRPIDAARIEALARDIEDRGLDEPVVLIPIGNRYLLLSGHRRTRAFRLLASEGKQDFAKIPAIVRESTDDIRAEEALIGDNLFSEGLSDAEKAREMERKLELLKQRKERGEHIPGRLRDIVAEQLGINAETARRYDTIARRAEPEVKEKFERGEISTREAFLASRKSPEEQRKLMQRKEAGAVLFPTEPKPAAEVVHVPPETAEPEAVHVPPASSEIEGLLQAQLLSCVVRALGNIDAALRGANAAGLDSEQLQQLLTAYDALGKVKASLDGESD